MNVFKRIIYRPKGGMFREFVGITTQFEPADNVLYQELLPKPFILPDRPLVRIFVADYISVFPWPMTRYQEWAVLLKSTWKEEEGWYVLTMPVTKWIPMRGGRMLGFPKYIAESIRLVSKNDSWIAEGKHKGILQLAVEFKSGMTRELHQWEKTFCQNESFYDGNLHLLVPPNQGPKVQTIKLEHVITPKWSSIPGMVKIVGDARLPWKGLVPKEITLAGKFSHFKGGFNISDQELT